MAKLLSRSDVKAILKMPAEIDILDKAFQDLANGKVNMPQRTPIRNDDGLALFMPCYLPGMGALGAKTVTVFPKNPKEHNLGTTLGTLLLLDPETGKAKAIMDAGFLTGMRTGGVAGLATRALAREDAEVHVLFGSGGMALTHAWAVDCVRNIKKLVLFSLDPKEKREAFAATLKPLLNEGCEIVLADDAKTAVGMADILTLITSSKEPVLDGDWLKPGTHINGIGSHAPAMRELDPKTINRSKVICDLLAACQAESGDFLIPVKDGEWSWDKVHGDLGDVLIGKIPGRENKEEITLFKSNGLAIQDMATAHYVLQKATEQGLGQEFDFMG